MVERFDRYLSGAGNHGAEVADCGRIDCVGAHIQTQIAGVNLFPEQSVRFEHRTAESDLQYVPLRERYAP